MKRKVNFALAIIFMLQTVILGGLISSAGSYSHSLARPTDLRAIEITTNSARLRWANSQTNSASEYEIYMDNSKIGTVNTTGANISNLSEDTIYKFKVRAMTSDGDKSSFSSEISIKTSNDNQLILPPINTEAVEVGHNQVRLSWDSPYQNLDIEKYEIYHEDTLLGNVSSTHARISNLTEDTKYIFEIVSVHSSGKKSNSKALIPVKTLSKEQSPDMQKPSNLELVEVTNNIIRFKWEQKQQTQDISGYYIYLDDARLGSVSNVSARLSNLSPDTKYKIAVVAFDKDGNTSDPSDILTVKTLSTDQVNVLPPNNLRATQIHKDMVRLRWDAPDNQDIARYRVYSNNTSLGTVRAQGAIIQSLNPGSTYQYQISAIDSEGNESAKSDILTITTVSD